MPNKTIYVREDDLPLWEEAQKELGESISALSPEGGGLTEETALKIESDLREEDSVSELLLLPKSVANLF